MPRRRISVESVVAGILLACLFGTALGGRYFAWQRADANRPRIVVEPKALDFGSAWADASFVGRVPVFNAGRHPVIIDQLTGDRDSTSIPPQTHGWVPVPIDLTRAPLTAESRYSVRVPWKFAGTNEPRQEWVLHGTLKRAWTASSPMVEFHGPDRVVRGLAAIPEIVQLSPYRKNLQIVATADERIVNARVDPPAEGDSAFRLVITPNRALPAGRFSTRVAVVARLPDGQSLPGVSLPVTGLVYPDIRAIPPILTFSWHGMHDLPEARVVLESKTGGEFQIYSAKTRAAEIVRAMRPGHSNTRHEMARSLYLMRWQGLLARDKRNDFSCRSEPRSRSWSTATGRRCPPRPPALPKRRST